MEVLGETKYFNEIQGWRIEKLEQPEPLPIPREVLNTIPNPQEETVFEENTSLIGGESDVDNLPF